MSPFMTPRRHSFKHNFLIFACLGATSVSAAEEKLDFVRDIQPLLELNCISCHGPGAIAGGTIPDLRFSSEATYDALDAIVLSGTFEAVGMPSFAAWLGPEDVAAIRAYLLERRAALLAADAK